MNIKTLDFNSLYGKEKLALQVSTYSDNKNLFIGLWSKNGADFEPYTDLTKNLGIKLNANEAFVKTFDENEGLFSFITKHKLGEVLPEKGRSGFCEYHKIAFNMERLAEFDSDGVKNHLKFHEPHVKQKTDIAR